MAVPPTLHLQRLLDEDQWIRRLARGIAGDAQGGEELAQEAWVAALGARAPAPKSLRPWLRGCLRNLWSDAERRRRARVDREHAVARAEALSATSELVAELELRKLVAEALLALEEPYRRTLYLRFFKDQSLARIAAHEKIALSTVHGRIQQGLERLRARLDSARGGRRDWVMGLFALAAPARSSVAVLEALAMAAGIKVAVAASVFVVAGVAWWWMEHDAPQRAVETTAAPSATRADAGADAELARAAAHGERTELFVPVAATPEPAPPPAEAALTRGRVVDPHAAPLAGVAVGWSDAPPGAPSVRSGLDGAYAIERGAHGADARILAQDAGLVTLVPGAPARLGRPESWLVVVAPRADFAGHVVDPAGAPVPGAKVSFGLKEALFRELGLHRLEFAGNEGSTTTDADGAFELAGIAGGDRVLLQVEAEGFWIASFDLPETSASDLVIRLERDARALTITGLVLGPQSPQSKGGEPVAGARVSAGDRIVQSAADGRFELTLGPTQGTFGPLETEKLLEEALRDAHLVALKQGFGPAREPLAGLDLAVPVILRLGAAAQSIRGRVVDSERVPRAGAVVWVSDPTPFGREVQAVAEGTSVAWQQTVEAEFAGGFAARGATCNANGEFELGCLLGRDYELCAFDPRTAEMAGPFTVRAGREGVELVLPRAARRGRVAGRVVSFTKQPLAGVVVSPRRSASAAASVHSVPPQSSHLEVETDAEGRFEFSELALDGTELLLQDERFFLRTFALERVADPARLEIVEPLLCELQVDLTNDPGRADTVQVLDAGGTPLETMESFDGGWSLGTEAHLRNGLSSILSVRETAATLVLRKDGTEVLRQPLRLDPEQRTTVRP